MQRIMIGLLGLVVGITSAFGTTFTLKSSVSGVDFDWSLGSNYEGDPAQGPAAGDTIVIPNGVTALMNAEASTSSKLGKINVHVESDAILKTYHDGRTSGGRYQSYVKSLTGSGTVTTPDNQPSDVYADLAIGATCVFDGQIEGCLHYRMLDGVTFTLTQNQPNLNGSPLFNGTSGLWIGSAGSLGKGNFNLGSDSTFGYLGASGLSESLSKPSYEGLYFRLDSGAYGGLTFDLKMNDVARPRYVVLKGSNTTESVFGLEVKKGAGPLYVRKEGVGSWKLKNVSETSPYRQYDGVTDVAGGLLDYTGELKPTGQTCGLGTATNLYRFGSGTPLSDSARIPHAILLGGDEANAGLLRSTFSTTGIQTNYDRLIGLTGRGGFLSGPSRLHYDGITAASAGAKTLVLDGDKTNNDTVSNVTNGPGVVAVEKRGTGTWTLQTPFKLGGGVSVKEGTLEIRNGAAAYEWIRITFKQNAYNDPLFKETCEKWWRDAAGSDASDSELRKLTLGEFMLFDATGRRHGVMPLAHYKEGSVVGGKTMSNSYAISETCTNRCVALLEPGQFMPEDPDLVSYLTCTRPLGALFEKFGRDLDGNVIGDKVISDQITYTYGNDWMDISFPKKFDLNDSSTWVRLVLRLPKGTPPIVACDFVKQYVTPGRYGGRSLTAFSVDGSTDGCDWHELLNVRLTELWDAAAARSGTSASTTTIDAATLAKCFWFTETVPAATASVTIDGPVSVAPGATLACFGTVSISSIKLSDAGMGTIEGANVSLAEEGSFEVEKLMSSSKTFHTSLKGLSGADNLVRWKATVNGVEQNYDVAYDAATGDVTVSKRGLMLLVR